MLFFNICLNKNTWLPVLPSFICSGSMLVNSCQADHLQVLTVLKGIASENLMLCVESPFIVASLSCQYVED